MASATTVSFSKQIAQHTLAMLHRLDMYMGKHYAHFLNWFYTWADPSRHPFHFYISGVIAAYFLGAFCAILLDGDVWNAFFMPSGKRIAAMVFSWLGALLSLMCFYLILAFRLLQIALIPVKAAVLLAVGLLKMALVSVGGIPRMAYLFALGGHDIGSAFRKGLAEPFVEVYSWTVMKVLGSFMALPLEEQFQMMREFTRSAAGGGYGGYYEDL